MAISEVTVKNSTQMAIDEINAAGGVMGKQVEAVTEDGASDPATFAQKATKLIDSDGVVTVFGGRSEEHTSELQSLMRISYAVFCLKKKTPPYEDKHDTILAQSTLYEKDTR